MGMFDEVRCHYPLPVEGANALHYQTKDTDCNLDQYEIREDGTLWLQERDWDDAKGEYANHRWVPHALTGQLCFYTFAAPKDRGWISWMAFFDEGKLLQPPKLLEHRLD